MREQRQRDPRRDARTENFNTNKAKGYTLPDYNCNFVIAFYPVIVKPDLYIYHRTTYRTSSQNVRPSSASTLCLIPHACCATVSRCSLHPSQVPSYTTPPPPFSNASHTADGYMARPAIPAVSRCKFGAPWRHSAAFCALHGSASKRRGLRVRACSPARHTVRGWRHWPPSHCRGC
jgi:hypothetical protein